MKVRIVVDSVADVTESVKARLTVVPLNIHFGEEEYIDDVNITRQAFYEKLEKSKVLPTTSQPSPDAFAQVFEAAKQAGEEVVVLTVSSRVSGTHQSALIAQQDYPENVYVVDTMNVAVGEGVLAEYALSLADKGLNAAEIAQEIIRVRDDVCLIALVDTLEYLHRGGRLPKAVAIAGGLLSIKPLLTMKNGVLEVMSKARGSKQGNMFINKEIEAAGGVDFDKPVLLSYTGTSDELLQKYVRDSTHMWQNIKPQERTTQLCGVVGTHAGPGAVVVAFFKNPMKA